MLTSGILQSALNDLKLSSKESDMKSTLHNTVHTTASIILKFSRTQGPLLKKEKKSLNLNWQNFKFQKSTFVRTRGHENSAEVCKNSKALIEGEVGL